MILAVILTAMSWWADSELDSGYAGPIRITPFTVEGGVKGHPRFSPDGERVAYEWDGPEGDNIDIFVKAMGFGAEPLRLTDHPDMDHSPAWSPDGREIAFTRLRADGTGAVFLIPSTGGSERKLVELEGSGWSGDNPIPLGAVSWSPDGKTLVFSEAGATRDTARIVRLSIATREKESLTNPSEKTRGDFGPEFSPDGRQIAFVRSEGAEFGDWDLWVQPTDGGEAQRLTERKSDYVNRPAWSVDGRGIFYVAEYPESRIWRVDVASGRLEAVAGLGSDVGCVATWGDRMVFEQRKNSPLNLWRIPVSGGVSVTPERVTVSSFVDWNADFSPDGHQIAFASYRGGSANVWVSNNDGSDPVQLTQFQEHTGTPRWSPDGKVLLFDSLHSGNADLWLVDPEGGVPRQLTTDPTDEVMGTWSRDGRWIYFSSPRTGRSEIYRIPSGGGSAVQLTSNGGWYSRESMDGKYLYYSKGDSEPGLYRLPLAKPGNEEIVVPAIFPERAFAPGVEGVYFADRSTGFTIRFFNFKSGVISDLFPSQSGGYRVDLAVSSDEQWILFGESPFPESELMLVENFH